MTTDLVSRMLLVINQVQFQVSGVGVRGAAEVRPYSLIHSSIHQFVHCFRLGAKRKMVFQGSRAGRVEGLWPGYWGGGDKKGPEDQRVPWEMMGGLSGVASGSSGEVHPP